ncbi:hypothetical protein N657DRAFT_454870 [Parathielavia appendiculata]|uniref:Uncharacterized protein n=1 Tax=Parathielavia appendiculata TaxID=2587402 RepID=A0AAN6Z360_9PEZI|nr:hypothetical protein N657DRAFT_454870 [Parathielavia appendiculata]
MRCTGRGTPRRRRRRGAGTSRRAWRPRPTWRWSMRGCRPPRSRSKRRGGSGRSMRARRARMGMGLVGPRKGGRGKVAGRSELTLVSDLPFLCMYFLCSYLCGLFLSLGVGWPRKEERVGSGPANWVRRLRGALFFFSLSLGLCTSMAGESDAKMGGSRVQDGTSTTGRRYEPCCSVM